MTNSVSIVRIAHLCRLGYFFRHQVAHLTTIGHTRQKSIVAAEIVFLLKIARQFAKKIDIIRLQSRLKRIAYVPDTQTS